MGLADQIREASEFLRAKVDIQPKVGLILGSGLGELADQITSPIHVTYQSIPHFPESTVEGHKGQLVIGELGGKQVVAMQGRFHYYEGYSMVQITFPVRVMKQLGVETMIVTNACGALNETFKPGIFMFIEDHINLTGDNPLIGENLQDHGPRFPDMSSAYDKQLIRLGLEIAQQLEIEVATGIHTAVSGPNFLSRAELKMIKKMGSDTIGMSTIPEVIVAVHSGLKVLGISCVTDMAVPEQLEPIDHEKVMEMAAQSKPNFIRLVSEIIGQMEIE